MSGGVPSWAVSSSTAAIFGSESASKAATIQDEVSSAPLRLQQQKSIMRCPPLADQHLGSDDARAALCHVIALHAAQAGFDASTRSALHEIEHLTKRFLAGIFAAAQHAAELSSRNSPSARDLLYALETHGQSVKDLQQHFHANQHPPLKRRPIAVGKAQGSSQPEIDGMFLPSDSDSGSEMESWSYSSESDGEFRSRRSHAAARLDKHRHVEARRAAKRQRRQKKLEERQRSDPDNQMLVALESGEEAWHRVADHIVPRHLPSMPPRHTWMQTAAYPTNAYAAADSGSGLAKNHPLVLVNRKLANARLVESSLRSLIQNTSEAAANAYSASREDKPARPLAQKPVLSPRSSSPAAIDSANASVSMSAPPKTPVRAGLTLRLKSKIGSNSSSTVSTPTAASPTAQGAIGRRSTLTTPLGNTQAHSMFGFGFGLDPLMSPITPAPGSLTPSLPPSSSGFNWSLPAGLRSRKNSVAVQLDADKQDADLQLRIPGAVNYKNVWYAPGSTIQSGGLASAAGQRNSTARPTAVKRLRKWKV